jgi:hypothetical protein
MSKGVNQMFFSIFGHKNAPFKKVVYYKSPLPFHSSILILIAAASRISVEHRVIALYRA